MDLYLDSVDFDEIEQALEFGFIKGLTTTPTFMHRHGIKDIDSAIVKLSGMVPELQVEALGETPDSIINEAKRILALPLKQEPVFKVPISVFNDHGLFFSIEVSEFANGNLFGPLLDWNALADTWLNGFMANHCVSQNFPSINKIFMPVNLSSSLT